MEPLKLKNLCEMKVGTLRDASSLIKSGESLVYSFQYPQALYLGYIPKEAVVIWRYPKTENLYIQKCGWTYFTWSHATELVILTGLVSHVYEIGSLKVRLTFYIYDPMKFASSLRASELDEKFTEYLEAMFKDKGNDDFSDLQNMHYISIKFMDMNRQFQKFGVAVTAIDPPGYNGF